jgi:DNA repair exonuclease SbcCD ATPase subunit
MITLKTLKWSNLFSYGRDNVVDFNNTPIVQLVGKNGHGKSSIALVLEEVLYNKNSKGIKKADILNRNTKDKSYSIELDFEKDGEEYKIQTSRGSTQTVTLYKGTDNISAHTATVTFKLLEDIIGFDHKTFAQLVYQSSGSSLEFLTATDTNRKKFLIDLLNLTKYVEAHEIFKKVGKEVELELAAVTAKIGTTQAWLDKNSKVDLTPRATEGVPVLDQSIPKELGAVEAELRNIDDTNRRIAKNNIHIKQLKAIDPTELTKVIDEDTDTTKISGDKGGHQQTIKIANALISKIEGLNGTCPTCMQPVDRDKLLEIMEEQQILKRDAALAISKIDTIISERNALRAERDRLVKMKQEWEYLHSQISKTLPVDAIDGAQLEKRIAELKVIIFDNEQEVNRILALNEKTHTHNSRVEVIKSQMESMRKELAEYSESLAILTEKLNIIQVLQKTFSTNGLIAYKIECLVKDLEDLANQYLADLSGGRFQLMFKVSSGDKLNVIINDNGRDIDILALSGGERARVNTATLLAIRKLMQSLSNARINLLVLDETVDALDVDGKEKLVEVLLKEEHLNTFLISHGFTHPLLEKILVIKEHNISRLE